ncbi:MAG: hypothetical protein Q8L48_16745 [Archangium sp.]|nr:hypothetical protein [Archangium sp.]
MAVDRQTSFSAGELSPYLYGRTDLELWRHGARQLLNHFVSLQGSAVTRPGTLKLATAKLADVVLIPFNFSDDLSYVLEFGEYYVRVHHPTSGYTGTEVATPFRAADLPALTWAQVGLVLFLAHPSYDPRELRAPVVGLSVAWVMVETRYGPPADTIGGTQSLTPVFKDKDGNLRLPPMLQDLPADVLFADDADHPVREWKYKASALLKHNVTGEVVESTAVDVTEYFDGTSRPSVATIPADNLLVLGASSDASAKKNIKLRHPTFGPVVGSLANHVNWTPVGIVYYRGRGKLFGFIGTTQYAATFVDDAREPDYLRPPLRGDRPFQLGEYPASVAFFAQRRWWGGSSKRFSTLWSSAVDDWGNHDAPFPPFIPASGPLEFDLYARRRERVRHMVAARRLLVFTDTSVWSIGGGEAGVISPETIEARMEDETGASSLPPLLINGTVLYTRAKGRGVVALAQSEGGSYRSQDVSWHAEHLFRGDKALVSWCFQKQPWGVVWAVRSDGVLLSCTPTAAGYAWARHTTGIDPINEYFDGDKVLSVTTVPTVDGDVVFLAVRRGGTTFIERMWLRDQDPSTDAPITARTAGATFAVDCAVAGEGNINTAFNVTGLDHLEGRNVYVTSTGNAPSGPHLVLGGSITVGPFPHANLAGNQVKVVVGLGYTADLETLNAAQARGAQKNVVMVGFEVDSAQGIKVGEDFTHLVKWQQRVVADSYEFPSAASVLAEVKVKGSWRKTGRAVLRQELPLPVIVLGITRDIDTGGER